MPTGRLDTLAVAALQRGDLHVDPTTGAVSRPDGSRAEIVDKRTGAGRVILMTRPLSMAMAHRVVWIAAHGPPPPGSRVGHLNHHLWDNRVTNLTVAPPRAATTTRAGLGMMWGATPAGSGARARSPSSRAPHPEPPNDENHKHQPC